MKIGCTSVVCQLFGALPASDILGASLVKMIESFCATSATSITGATSATTLQKQIGCFNHRVVTMVADKLERQEVFCGMEV